MTKIQHRSSLGPVDEAQAATMLTAILTIRGFDTAGAVCATGPVFGRLRRRGELTLPHNGQVFLWPARFEHPVPQMMEWTAPAPGIGL